MPLRSSPGTVKAMNYAVVQKLEQFGTDVKIGDERSKITHWQFSPEDLANRNSITRGSTQTQTFEQPSAEKVWDLRVALVVLVTLVIEETKDQRSFWKWWSFADRRTRSRPSTRAWGARSRSLRRESERKKKPFDRGELTHSKGSKQTAE